MVGFLVVERFVVAAIVVDGAVDVCTKDTKSSKICRFRKNCNRYLTFSSINLL